jgi:hypothetical protein
MLVSASVGMNAKHNELFRSRPFTDAELAETTEWAGDHVDAGADPTVADAYGQLARQRALSAEVHRTSLDGDKKYAEECAAAADQLRLRATRIRRHATLRGRHHGHAASVSAPAEIRSAPRARESRAPSPRRHRNSATKRDGPSSSSDDSDPHPPGLVGRLSRARLRGGWMRRKTPQHYSSSPPPGVDFEACDGAIKARLERLLVREGETSSDWTSLPATRAAANDSPILRAVLNPDRRNALKREIDRLARESTAESTVAEEKLRRSLERFARRDSLACAHCGVQFTPTRSDQRYHNDSCRLQAWRQRRRQARKATA